MSEPSVCAILLTADRPEFTRQAVECFRRQTYANKRLLVYDSSVAEIEWPEDYYEADDICLVENNPIDHHGNRKPIGYLRNRAVAFWTEFPIIVHWDSDDYSHPNRISEQVALLQRSGADVVGFNEMLFWRELKCCHWCSNEAGKTIYRNSPDGFCQECGKDLEDSGEAWLYSNPNPQCALGTSLAYRREVWERKPFEATSIGEDEKFIRGLKVAAVSSIATVAPFVCKTSALPEPFGDPVVEPRMIARIHAGNTSTAYEPRKMEHAHEWRRAAEWDKYCHGVFA